VLGLPKVMMQKQSDIPYKPGVYAIAHPATKVVYVGQASDLRHRATIWDHHFKMLMHHPDYTLPVKGMPRHPGPEWHFTCYVTEDVEEVRATYVKQGYSLINLKQRRQREAITHGGKTQTLAEHARDAGVPYNVAYYRFNKGKPMDEVLAKAEEGAGK
jgi:hypothetical protein